jgi:hypothetical protein
MKRCFLALFAALYAFACSTSPVTTATATAGVAVSVIVGTQSYACSAVRPPTGGSTAVGGASSIGGRMSTGGTSTRPVGSGGANSSGGHVSTGGLVSTGGYQGTGGSTVACAAITWPATPAAEPAAQARMARSHKFHPRHHRKAGRSPAVTERELSTACSTWAQPIDGVPLDQIDGSCTGHGLVGMISTSPFTSATHFNETDALAAYQGGTCLDNGCSIPCNCASCPKAYCPATHANDTGSYGSSVASWAVKLKWLGGYLAADTTTDLFAGLAKSGCMGGFDWYYSMMSTTSTGQLKVTVSSGLAGGHEPEIVGHDAVNKRTWIRNSWGNAWGVCNAQGCGYAWIADSDLTKLNFDADCPELPAN